jgi:hypothetical protein
MIESALYWQASSGGEWLLCTRRCQSRGAHIVLILDIGSSDGLMERREARVVPEHVRDSNPFLAIGCELGPVLGDAVVVRQQTPVDRHGHHGRRNGLAGRVDDLQRVAVVSALGGSGALASDQE